MEMKGHRESDTEIPNLESNCLTYPGVSASLLARHCESAVLMASAPTFSKVCSFTQYSRMHSVEVPSFGQ